MVETIMIQICYFTLGTELTSQATSLGEPTALSTIIMRQTGMLFGPATADGGLLRRTSLPMASDSPSKDIFCSGSLQVHLAERVILTLLLAQCRISRSLILLETMQISTLGDGRLAKTSQSAHGPHAGRLTSKQSAIR